MAKPWIHAESSARRFGGIASDYFPIHDFLDSSKGAIPDNRHRALTHNAWFLKEVLEKIHIPSVGWLGPNLYRPSDGVRVSVRDIGEQHILEDFGGRFIPTAQDYLQEIEPQQWMNGTKDAEPPSSHQWIEATRTIKTFTLKD